MSLKCGAGRGRGGGEGPETQCKRPNHTLVHPRRFPRQLEEGREGRVEKDSWERGEVRGGGGRGLRDSFPKKNSKN